MDTNTCPIWILEAKEKDGDLEMRTAPLSGAAKVVSFTDTRPSTVCKGEDHKGPQCNWGRNDNFNMYWGKTLSNRASRPIFGRDFLAKHKDDVKKGKEKSALQEIVDLGGEIDDMAVDYGVEKYQEFLSQSLGVDIIE